MKIEDLKLYDVIIDENNPLHGVKVMSIVDVPAVKKDFMSFSESNVILHKYSTNDDEKKITGVALRANYPIKRIDEDGSEYFIRFRPEVIRDIEERFMYEMNLKNVNIQHNINVEGIFLIESYILNKNHQVNFNWAEGIDDGSWIVTYKVNNENIWKDIKEGKLRGFSVEVGLDLKEVNEEIKMCSEDKQNNINDINIIYNYFNYYD